MFLRVKNCEQVDVPRVFQSAVTLRPLLIAQIVLWWTGLNDAWTR
jgi:hypothetical protein